MTIILISEPDAKQDGPSNRLPPPETTKPADNSNAPYEGDSEEDFPGKTIAPGAMRPSELLPRDKLGNFIWPEDTDSEASDDEGDSEDDAPILSSEEKAARARQKDEANEPEDQVSADLQSSSRLATNQSIASLRKDPANADLVISIKNPAKKRGKKKNPAAKSGVKPSKSARKKPRAK